MAEPNGSALVIGAGIAGIQAALDLAAAGVSVHLVEQGDFIGGRMAQLDKTFPTLDCSSCTLTPRTVEVETHPNIRLLTRTDIVELHEEGTLYRARLRVRPRFVDPAACVSCGRCTEACRLRGRVVSEFDAGLGKGSAVGLSFPQAVPSSYAVNPEACLYLTRGKCGKGPRCLEACAVDAIHLDAEDRYEELLVGAVVVATGYSPYRPEAAATGRPELAFGRHPEVLTNLQFERLCSPTGPTGGEIRIGEHPPRRVAFLQCVGSRDRTTGAAYCSRVCCMASIKQALLAVEKLPGVEASVLYMDLRAFGKGYEEFYQRAQRVGVLFRRGNPAEIYRRGNALVVRFEDTLLGRTEELATDLIVLAAGLRPRADMGSLAAILGLPLDSDGFLASADAKDPAVTRRGGIVLAGTCRGPMDIPDAVASGSAAAAAALGHLQRGSDLATAAG